jgi:IS1 family transposase/transposase-like protein
MKTITHPPLESLACVTPECELYGQPSQNNLSIRKWYGKNNHIRYLRCKVCQKEFSERKNTPLWNSKIPEERAISIAEHLAEGCSTQSTVRLTKSDISTVNRLPEKLGKHAQTYHNQHVQDIEISTLQADERHGFVGGKQQPHWEGELIDPQSKFVISHIQGKRDNDLIYQLLADGASRLRNRHTIALFTDGLVAYRRFFPELFGMPYQPQKRHKLGRPRKTAYRVPHTLAHVQIIKHRAGRRLKALEIRYTHGSKKRINQALDTLGYQVPNTSCIERCNATARSMSAAQVRKTLAFAKRDDTKVALGWWATTVYNWCRTHRSLKRVLLQPMGKKSINNAHQLWLLV